MSKMSFKFARRVRNLEIKTYCPPKKKNGFDEKERKGRGQLACPSCALPSVVAFIFVFTVVQLIVINRTIVSYKTRSLAFEKVYGPSRNVSKAQGDLLAFSKKFDAVWPNTSRVIEWKPVHSYPYRIPRVAHPPSIDNLWKVACPEVPTKLHGNISINVKQEVLLEELSRNNSQLLLGGNWTPEDCKPRFHVALIIPYRFRWNHLKLLLSVLHPLLRRQQLSYQVFVAEQFGNYTFNKGLLMNAAFLLALNSSRYFDCVIFHDVDLLPETDRNIYGCANSPAHLSVSIDAYGYRLPYSKLVGGVFAISVSHFIQVNGYSNLYWGWGAEDDDMYKRLIANQLPLSRPRPDLAKYKMLQHGRRVPNQFINPLIRTARVRFPQDGLTTCHFRLVSSKAQTLFTHLLIDVGQPSYSVIQPNIPLESLIPQQQPPPSSLLRNAPYNMTMTSSSSSSPSSSSSHHNHHRQSLHFIRGRDINISPLPSRKISYSQQPSSTKNRLEQMNRDSFLLSGIARDNQGYENTRGRAGDGKHALPENRVKTSSVSGKELRDGSSKHLSSSKESFLRFRQQETGNGNNDKIKNLPSSFADIPLDPVVPKDDDVSEMDSDENAY